MIFAECLPELVDDERIEWVYDRRSQASITLEHAVALGYPRGFPPRAASPDHLEIPADHLEA